jgi:hypothetical protein
VVNLPTLARAACGRIDFEQLAARDEGAAGSQEPPPLPEGAVRLLAATLAMRARVGALTSMHSSPARTRRDVAAVAGSPGVTPLRACRRRPNCPRRPSAAAIPPLDFEPTDGSTRVTGFSTNLAANRTSSHDDIGLSERGRWLKPGKNLPVLL